MDKKLPTTSIGIIFALGAVWGLSEAAVGMWLKNCASSVSGSLMTGFAFIFIAASWFLSRRALGVVLLVLVASLFKLFDAFLLSLPILHGAIANPIFAFVLEGAVFLACVALFKKILSEKTKGKGLLGGAAALGAVGLFPLVKFFTGIPACVVPGTGIPLSIAYAPLAIVLSAFTVPLGFWLGEKIEGVLFSDRTLPKFYSFISPVTLILCLVLVYLIRTV